MISWQPVLQPFATLNADDARFVTIGTTWPLRLCSFGMTVKQLCMYLGLSPAIIRKTSVHGRVRGIASCSSPTMITWVAMVRHASSLPWLHKPLPGHQQVTEHETKRFCGLECEWLHESGGGKMMQQLA